MPNYTPNLPSFSEGFPASLQPPALLLDFAAWLAAQPRSSLGWFHLESSRLDERLAGDDTATALLREQLGLFLICPDGSRLALWRQCDSEPRVVRIGARGEREEIAPDLATFLWSMARGETGIALIDRDQTDSPATRGALAGWLSARGLEAKSASSDTGEFARWFEATIAHAKQAGQSQARPAPALAELPADLWTRVDPLLGLLSDDPRVVGFFEGIGVDLGALRDPEALRLIAREREGVAFELAWPWDYPSEWLEREFPRARRKALEEQRVRMFWSLTLFVTPGRRALPSGRRFELSAYAGSLPFGIERSDDPPTLERKLGPPVLGNLTRRTWDDPKRGRSLVATLNDGPGMDPSLARGALTTLSYRRGQSV